MSERILEFKVDKQLIQKMPGCDFSGIVAGSAGYLKAKFHFSDEWKDCVKVASFGTVDLASLAYSDYPIILDKNDMCEIPSDVLVGQTFLVHVVGGKKPHYRINTNVLKVRQEVNINANS